MAGDTDMLCALGFASLHREGFGASTLLFVLFFIWESGSGSGLGMGNGNGKRESAGLNGVQNLIRYPAFWPRER